MKFLFGVTFLFVFFQNNFYYSQQTVTKALCLIEYGKYDEAISLLTISSKSDSIQKKWSQWIKKEKIISDCHYKLYNQKELLGTVNKIEKIIKRHKLIDSKSLGYYYESKGKMYFQKEDVDVSFKYIKKNISLLQKTKTHTDKDFLPVFTRLTLYYNYKNDDLNALFCAKKLISIINLHKNKIHKNDLTEAYNQIGFAYTIQPFNDQTTYLNNYKKSKEYYELALQTACHNPLLKAQVYHYIGDSYFNMLFDKFEKYRYLSNLELLEKGNYYYDKSIEINKIHYGNNSILLSKSYFHKGYIYTNFDPLIALNLYNKTLSIMIPNWKKTNTILYTPTTSSHVINKPFTLTVLYHKASLLSKLYSQTSDINYQIAAFRTIDYATQLCKKMLSEYHSSSPYQILNIYSITPFQKAINIAYSLYECTHNEYYKLKIVEYAESNKYSDIIKGYIQSLKTNKKSKTSLQSLFVKNISLKKIQSKFLTPTNCVIEYTFDSEGNLYGILLLKKSLEVLKLDSLPDSLDSTIKNLQLSIEKSDVTNYKKNAHLLYKKIFAVLSQKIPKKVKQLIIIPDKMLSFIPFDALLYRLNKNDSKDYRNLHYLFNKYEISEQLSLTIAEYLKNNPRNKSKYGIFGLATGEMNNMNSLPYSLKSITYFEDKYKGIYLYGTDANKTNFKKYSTSSSVIFLATHAIGNISNSKESKIYLHKSNEIKGGKADITLNNIYGLSLHSELVVLSACETSLGEYQTGEGILSFERAFVFSGSKSVLSTLWKTDDLASHQILTTFIDNLSKQQTKSKSLYHSKKHFLNMAHSSDDANPLYWAGFKLIGDDAPIKIRSKNNTNRYILISLFTLISFSSLYIVFKKRKLVFKKLSKLR